MPPICELCGTFLRGYRNPWECLCPKCDAERVTEREKQDRGIRVQYRGQSMWPLTVEVRFTNA